MDITLIMLLTIGLAFIIFGIFVLFLPEVDEKGRRTLAKKKESKDKKGFFVWFTQRNTLVGIITFLVGGALLLTLLTPSFLDSSSSSTLSSSNTSTTTSQTTSTIDTSSSTNSSEITTSTVPSSSDVISSVSLPQYTVTFVSEGSSVDPQIVEENSLLVEPDTTLEGHTYIGWYASDDQGDTLGVQWDFLNDRVIADMTLYAGFDMNTYTITYVMNGTFQTPASSFLYQAITVAPTDPIRNGYTFGGWFSNIELTVPFVFGEPMPAQNLTLYAKWTINQYTITLHVNSCDALEPITLNFGQTVPTLPTPTKTDALFLGWYTNTSYVSVFNSGFAMPGNNLNAYAKWNWQFTDVWVGGNFSIARGVSGAYYAWGGNANGQLGLGTTANLRLPTLMPTPWVADNESIVDIVLGYSSAYAFTSDQKLFAWGSVNGSSNPMEFTISGLNPAETIQKVMTSPYSGHTFYITSESRIFAVGSNIEGQLGIGTNGPSASTSTPTLVTISDLDNANNEVIVSIATGSTHTLFISNLNRVWGAGRAIEGQLGINSTPNNANTPTRITTSFLDSGETIDYVKLGQNFSFIVSSNQRVFVFGSRNYGIYGDAGAATVNYIVPTVVEYSIFEGDETIVQLEVITNSAYILTSSGRMFGWGFGGQSALGLGGNTASEVPLHIPVTGLFADETIIAIDMSSNPVGHALTSSNRLLSWGRNIEGQVGNNTSLTFVVETPTFI